MKLINFVLWLSAGAIVGWFASRMVQFESRRTYRPVLEAAE